MANRKQTAQLVEALTVAKNELWSSVIILRDAAARQREAALNCEHVIAKIEGTLA